ncbi:MAG: hypothetical protein IKO57_08460 [Treponema sp.]|nr:hypothetical protein [Treponema sp.]
MTPTQKKAARYNDAAKNQIRTKAEKRGVKRGMRKAKTIVRALKFVNDKKDRKIRELEKRIAELEDELNSLR